MPRTLTLLALLAAALQVQAQPTVDFGVRVGGNLTSLEAEFDLSGFDFSIDTDHEIGFEVAALADVSLSNLFVVAAELGYAHRRYSQSIPFQPGNNPPIVSNDEVTYSTSFDTGSFALLGHVRPLGRTPIAPYLIAGPRVDVLLGSEAEEEGPEGGDDPGSPNPVLLKDFFPEFFDDVSLSVVAGVGVEWNRAMGPGLRAEVRYDRTLTDFIDGDIEGTVSGLGLSVGATF